MEKEFRGLLWVLLPLLLFVFDSCTDSYLTKRKIESELCKVVNSEVEKLYPNNVSNILYYREIEDNNLSLTKVIAYGIEKKVDIGDTIQISIVNNCDYYIRIYNPFPTKFEIDRCKNGCYTYKGELFTKEELLKRYPDFKAEVGE